VRTPSADPRFTFARTVARSELKGGARFGSPGARTFSRLQTSAEGCPGLGNHLPSQSIAIRTQQTRARVPDSRRRNRQGRENGQFALAGSEFRVMFHIRGGWRG